MISTEERNEKLSAIETQILENMVMATKVGTLPDIALGWVQVYQVLTVCKDQITATMLRT